MLFVSNVALKSLFFICLCVLMKFATVSRNLIIVFRPHIEIEGFDHLISCAPHFEFVNHGNYILKSGVQQVARLFSSIDSS